MIIEGLVVQLHMCSSRAVPHCHLSALMGSGVTGWCTWTVIQICKVIENKRVSFWVGERHQNSSQNWSTLGMSYVMWLWQVRTNVDLSFKVSVVVFQLIFWWFIMTMVTLVFDVFTLFMWFKTAPLTCNSVTLVTFKFSTNTLVCAQQMLLSFFTITLFTFKQSWEGMCGKSTK